MKKMKFIAILAGLSLCCSGLWAKGSQDVKDTMKQIMKHSEPTMSYSIKSDLPYFEDNSELNKLVVAEGTKIKNEFYKLYNEYVTSDAKPLMLHEFSLYIDYKKIEKNDNTISFMISAESFTGGAHANSVLYPINYDVKAKKLISLEEVMKMNGVNTENWLTKLSSEAKKQLMEQIKSGKLNTSEDMMKDGISAKAENFKNFTIEKNGVKIYFQDYSIAPHSEGCQSIIVPFSALK